MVEGAVILCALAVLACVFLPEDPPETPKGNGTYAD